MVLLQTMLTVATQYKTVSISNALNSDFLNALLRGVAMDPDPAIRIVVQKILHELIDRHGNTSRLLSVKYVTLLVLCVVLSVYRLVMHVALRCGCK